MTPQFPVFVALLALCLAGITAIILYLFRQRMPPRTVYRDTGESDEKYMERILTAGDVRALLAYKEEKDKHSDFPRKNPDNQ